MSQNALLRGSKGLVGKGSSLATKNQSAESNTAHSNNQNNNISALKSKNKQQHNSDDNHNTKHEKESVNPSQSTIIKPTADQLRLAQITGGGKSDDPEINKKIKQVHDVVPFKVQDEILMALHENDYDIAKTIEFFLEGGGDLSQDWKTAGIRTKKPNSSPNQTLEESEVEEVSLVTNQQSNSHRINNKPNSKQNDSQNNARSRDKNRNSTSGKPSTGGPTGKFIKNKNDQANNVDESVSNLDDRFANSMDLNSRDNNGSADQHNNDQPFYNNNNQQRNNNNRRGNYSLSTRGASTNGGNYRGAGGGRGGGEGGGGGRAGRGRSNYRGGNNSARTHRKEDQIIADTGENHLPAPDEDKSDPLVSGDSHLVNEFDVNQENSALFSSQEPLIGEIPIEPINDMNKKSLSTVRGSREDNLKDIGTWSNEQADKNSSNRSSSSHKSNHFVNANNNNRQNNRYNNNTNNNHNTNAKNGGSGVNSLRQNDDWENDEEWQGDLTQTQIFTASAQKKENNAETSIDTFAKPRGGPATVIGASDQQVRQQFDSDFPIGHFNAEEASQTIKNAVGIGSGPTSSVNKKSSAIPPSAAAVSSSVNNLISEDAQSKEANKQQTTTNKQHQQQQQLQQNIRPNKFGSVKPPPPSTRIPKSAVVMPDGTSGNGFSLDVQFGVDLDSPLAENKAPVTESATLTNTAKILNEPVGRKLNMVSPQVLHNIPQPMNQQPSKPIGQQNVNKPVNSVQTSVSSNSSGSITAASSSSIGTFTSSTSSAIEKVANVGVVNPVINSSNSLQTNAGAVKLHDNSIVGVGVSANKIVDTNSMASSVPTTTIQQANILPHGMDGMKKLPQDNFIDVNKQKQPSHQQQQNNYQFQQQMNHLNIQKQQPASMSQKPSHQQYVQNQNDSNILNQQNMNQRENNNNHHYQQQQQQQHHQQQQHQQLNVNSNLNLSNSNQIKDSNSNQNLSQSAAGNGSQLLNISPQNIANKNSNPNQPNNVQLNQQQLMNANNALNQQSGLTSNAISNAANAAVVAAAGAVNMKQSAMPPPPGVNLVNPNSQFLMSLPFVCYDQQNFPYFDPSQIDGNSLMQMYNHLGLGVPPGVGSAAPTATGAGGATPGGPPYSITDSKFGRSEATNSNSQLNVNAAAAQLSQQQQQQQQQQPINLIPGLSNFPFFFHNYYPNMFMSVPNGPQTNPQFQNKPPYNFNNNNAAYDDQNKDYSNYNPQGQIKIPGSNLNNVPEINSVGYQKNVDKSNTGYHTPPPNYPNSLMNQQQQHPNVTGTTGAPPPPAQYAYITSMIGTPGGNPLVHTGLQQENINTRTIGGNNGANNIKPLQKTNYQNSPWN